MLLNKQFKQNMSILILVMQCVLYFIYLAAHVSTIQQQIPVPVQLVSDGHGQIVSI